MDPTGNGVATQGSPPTEWSDTKNVKWKVEIPGRENSSPVIWDQQVFVSTAAPVGGESKHAKLEFEFQILSFRSQNGQTVCGSRPPRSPSRIRERTPPTASLRPLPAPTASIVYAHFGSRGLYCYTMNGDLVWKRDDLGQDENADGLWRREFSHAGRRQDPGPLGPSRPVGPVRPRQADRQNDLEDGSR